MSRHFLPITQELEDYITSRSTRRDPLLTALAEETAALGDIARMQIAELQGSFMGLLTRAISARRAIEIGTFTGYSAICVARALPDDGKLLCCDVDEDWTRIARRYFDKAGIAHKIDLRLAPALTTLAALPAETPPFDIGFIDADKKNQGRYFEKILERLRPGGLILIDNVLRHGDVIDPNKSGEDLAAVRALNDALPRDPRVEVVMLPIADGLTLVRKRHGSW
jgi:predicted O-methyltransferase YrrM